MSATGTHDDLFQRLTTSALEFLRRAMAEAEANPKFALVHFCAGLELILKARLLREHWSLVVTSKPDLRKFQSGDFRESVSLGRLPSSDLLVSLTTRFQRMHQPPLRKSRGIAIALFTSCTIWMTPPRPS